MTGFFRRHPRATVFALGLLLLLPGIASLPLIDRDEPRFAQATAEMIHRGDWVVPWFNGDYRFDKPVLVYWLMRAGYALLGIGEAGARLHTVVSAAALAAWLFDTAKKWFSEKAGWIAAAGFLAGVQVQIHGRLCLADMPMVLAIAVASRALFELLHPENDDAPFPWKKWATLWLAVGIGFLAKGPVVLAVPTVALLLHRWVLLRRPLPWSRLKALPGLAVATAVVAPWGLLALWRTHNLFWKVGIGEHVVDRGVAGMGAQKPGSVFFYAVTIFVSLCPAIAYAGRILADRGPHKDPKRAWLLAWFLSPILIFTAYAAKLPHYILPGFPAFFLLLGACLAKPDVMRRGLLWQRALFGVYAALAAVAGLAGLLLWSGMATVPGAYDEGLREFGASLAHLAGAIVGAWLITFALSRSKPLRWAAPGVLLLAASFAGFAWHFRETSPSVALRPAMISPDLPADTRFVASGYQEGTLVFYADKRWTMIEDRKALAAELAKPGPVALVLLDERVRNERLLGAAFAGLIGKRTDVNPEDFREGAAALTAGFEERACVRGFSPGNGKWVTVRFLVRK